MGRARAAKGAKHLGQAFGAAEGGEGGLGILDHARIEPLAHQRGGGIDASSSELRRRKQMREKLDQ